MVEARRFGNLRERLPEPVVSQHTDVASRGPSHPINPINGFYADIEIKIQQVSGAGDVFRLFEAGTTPRELDFATIASSGTLRTIVEDGEKLRTLYVEPDGGTTTFSYKFFLTRHRVTGVI